MHPIDSDLRSRLMMARLPAMPQILLKLIEQCQTEDVGMGELAELIAKDPGMTCRILGIANSSAFHRGGRKVGLEQSLASLGTDMIKTLVISESVLQVFNGFNHSTHTDLRSFWKHSLSTAVMAGKIAERMEYPNAEEAYLAGLLHDVGRLALMAEAGKEYTHLFFAPDDEALCAIEQSLLKLTHAEVGAWLVERWNMDSFMADSLRYHHEPVDRVESAHPLVRIVLIAHALSMLPVKEGMGNSVAGLCGLSATELEAMRQDTDAQVLRFADLMGIDLTGAEELTVPAAGWEIAGMLAGPEGPDEPGTGNFSRERASSIQETTQHRLAQNVGSLLLSNEVGRSLATSQGSLSSRLDTILQSACLLFYFRDAVILRLDPPAKRLVGVAAGEHRQRLQEFTVALAGGGKIAESALQQHVSFVVHDDGHRSIAEEQLLRLLDSDAMVCIPLVSGSECAGVLIGGIAPWQATGLQDRDRFLKSFGQQAARSLRDIHPGAPEGIPAEDGPPASAQASRRVVHEANNALSIIKNYLGVLDGKLEKHQIGNGELSILHQEIDRVGQIIKDFSEPRTTNAPGVCDLNHVMADVTTLFRNTASIPETIRIAAESGSDRTEVSIGEGPLKQILVNLVKNAIEAMPGGGTIQIVNNGRVNLDGRLYSELCVRDTGPGIAQNILGSLFTPVHTSKGGHHQGLGLSIVHGLVQQAGGRITCRSSSTGTAFEILLPLNQNNRKTVEKTSGKPGVHPS